MPELPDLEAIRAVLNRKVRGAVIESVSVKLPLLIRYPTAALFESELLGARIGSTGRRGKFLLTEIGEETMLAVNPMLTGRFHLLEAKGRKGGRTGFEIGFDDGRKLRYTDQKLMGKVYLVPRNRLDLVPRFNAMGPDALEPEMKLDLFRERLRRYNGQIKNVLVNDEFIAGIGNAYADEILFAARIHPYRRRASLNRDEVDALWSSIRRVLTAATKTVADRMGDDISIKIRDFLDVHGKGGEPCPRCGASISQISANQRLTNFCRTCQPDRPS